MSGFVLLRTAKAVMATVLGDSALSSAVGGRIYDIRPQASALPCITLTGVSATAGDHKTRQGQTVTVTLSCWSTYEGRIEVLGLGRSVYNLFNEKPLTVESATASVVRCSAGNVIEDGDAVTRRIDIVLTLIVRSSS